MVFTVYKTTNLINNKFYIGVHQTKNPEDDYLGSGKWLKRSIKKYGLENFKKEILFIFENKLDAYLKEKELVNDELIKSELCYNLRLGGDGGFDYAITCIDKEKQIERAKKTQHLATNAAVIANKKKYPKSQFYGKKHSEESLEKMRQSKLDHGSGNKNSQYGKMWITNGIENKSILKEIQIPEGWMKGRANKSQNEFGTFISCRITDSELLKILLKSRNIKHGLLEAKLSPSGHNYKRAKELLEANSS